MISIEVYGTDGRLNRRFLSSTKHVLESVSNIADELRQYFPIPMEKSTAHGIPRMSAYLHLLYHQVRKA
jgi:proline utilization trans-activator